MGAARRLTLGGEGPRLAAELHLPPGPRAAAVVCHPHPAYGGSRASSLVVALADALAALGVAALRFDFRGAGESGGTSTAGAAEWDDAARALDALAGEVPGVPLGMAGYSFGAWVAAHQAARDPRVRALALVAPGPVGGVPLPAGVGAAALTVVGAERDTVFPLAATREWVAGVPGAALVVLPGADHFFAGRTGEAGAAAAEALAGALRSLP